MLRTVCPLLLVLAVALPALGPADVELPLQPEEIHSATAKRLAVRLPRLHVARKWLDDEMASRALNRFLTSLDYEHCYFLQSDIDRFNAQMTDLDDRLFEGDVTFAYEVFAIFLKRVENRRAYIDKLLEEGFDLEVDEMYGWRRRKAAWPKDAAERDEIWRKKIKNEYLSRVLAKERREWAKADEASKTSTNDVAAVEGEGEPAPATDDKDEPAKEAPGDADDPEVAEVDDEAEEEEPDATPEESIRKRYDRFVTVLNDNDAAWLTQKYLSAFTQSYDPHSEYMSPASAEDFDISMKLSLTGIGALLTTDEGAAKIVRLIAGGPAEQDGRLKPGDKIIAVGQGDEEAVDIMHWPLRKSVQLIRGEKGTTVVLTVIPASDSSGASTVKIDIVRDVVKLEAQAAKSRVEEITSANGETEKYGVIHLPAFYADLKGISKGKDGARSCTDDVAKLLVDMRTNDVAGIILDLRGNGGGSLKEAVRMTGLFFGKGPVVQMKDRRKNDILRDRDPDITYDGPLLVLVNRLSASASEILAAALQDYGRAIVVGDKKTHGKGTVQSVVPLDQQRDPRYGSLKVTTASFYRVNGSSTQFKGVTPDISIPSAYDAMRIGEEQLDHALPWTQEAPAEYKPVAELGDVITELRVRSEERRQADARYEARRNLLAKLAELQQAEEISLNLEARRESARREKELRDILKATDPEVDGDEKKETADLVVLEGMHILSDMIAIESAAAVAKTPAAVKGDPTGDPDAVLPPATTQNDPAAIEE